MKIYEIAFLAMATLMGVVTFIAVVVLVKRVTMAEDARKQAESDDDSTPQTPAP